MRFAIDDYQCQRCEATQKDSQLHCHHITGVVQNPIESADIDNTITLCKDCHRFVHSQPGCKYHELRCVSMADHVIEFGDGGITVN